jgi:hypothetical protein
MTNDKRYDAKGTTNGYNERRRPRNEQDEGWGARTRAVGKFFSLSLFIFELTTIELRRQRTNDDNCDDRDKDNGDNNIREDRG